MSAVGYGAWLNLLKGKLMETLIKLYITKIKTGYITDTEIDRYDALIELYITSMKTRLERRIKNGY